ncbi:hypothetical protein IWT25_00462 [Secundilactobacillus pentosiphilus]|uniref:Nucleoid-associated protein n=1 Tax=Secundilactobacillus pentosiphilus TaxID=1714682 RepID=A0A1Z5ITV8_9LACO|nr:nucleoid-associated protein [Secundilactobacillus pentosiphilus]GAX05159.1 hypothetical protein IWT25_00462 [Secundilactobacillus pentosiphilus]
MKILDLVVHVLDKESGNVVLSHKGIAHDNVLSNQYFEKMFSKFLKTNYDEVPLRESLVLTNYLRQKESFLNMTTEIAMLYFDLVKKINKIPSGDLLFFRVLDEKLGESFGMFKLDYNTGYTHEISYNNDVLVNNIIRNNSILPSPSQNVKEGFIVSGDVVKIKEKNYQYEGGKWSLSSNLLKISNSTKSLEKIRMVEKAINETATNYAERDILTKPIAEKAVYESIKMDSTIDPEYVADSVFDGNEQAKEKFSKTLEEKGISGGVKVPNPQFFEKKYGKQKIKLGNGIEIVVPVDLLKNKDFIEFRTNHDGTMSVLVKNIDGLNL